MPQSLPLFEIGFGKPVYDIFQGIVVLLCYLDTLLDYEEQNQK